MLPWMTNCGTTFDRPHQNRLSAMIDEGGLIGTIIVM